MTFILKLALGVGIAYAGLRVFNGRYYTVLLIGFVLLGIASQLIYHLLLNAYLGGVDPVREFGAHSLGELRRRISIPFVVIAVEVLAKAFGMAALIILSGMLHIFGAP